MHITASNPPSAANISANIRRLAALGLVVNISEMDVRIRDVPGPLPARLEVQKSVYKSIVGVCVTEPRCHSVTFWGFTDAHSWIDRQFGGDDPLLFDERYLAEACVLRRVGGTAAAVIAWGRSLSYFAGADESLLLAAGTGRRHDGRGGPLERALVRRAFPRSLL